MYDSFENFMTFYVLKMFMICNDPKAFHAYSTK